MATAALLLTVDDALTAAEATALATMSSDLNFIVGGELSTAEAAGGNWENGIQDSDTLRRRGR
jgi:hypothetical protein